MSDDIFTYAKETFITFKQQPLVENIKTLLKIFKQLFINKTIITSLLLSVIGGNLYHHFQDIKILKILLTVIGIPLGSMLFLILIINFWIVFGCIILLLISQIYKIIIMFINKTKESAENTKSISLNNVTEDNLCDNVINKVITGDINIEQAIDIIAKNSPEIEEKMQNNTFSKMAIDAKKLQLILNSIKDKN